MGGIYSWLSSLPTWAAVSLSIASIILTATVTNVIQQLYFPNPNRPPVVFHIFPLIGSTIPYGIDPYKFFFDCREKHGDCFTFVLLGKKTTAFLGPKGNNFILNGKHADLNAEGIYGKLTTPVFGEGVIYDCPNERLAEHRRVCIPWRGVFDTQLTLCSDLERRLFNGVASQVYSRFCPRS
jgi:sterol 14-demethylase